MSKIKNLGLHLIAKTYRKTSIISVCFFVVILGCIFLFDNNKKNNPLLYSVTIQNFWNDETYYNVKGDMIDEKRQVRILILEDETKIEIPLWGTIFEFSKERYNVIGNNIEKK